ncbi:MAG: hypothetical protein HZA50_12120 [Planctomycetes bacterium]|nr:hypothetical protein [Planctomycetota bacterium]
MPRRNRDEDEELGSSGEDLGQFVTAVFARDSGEALELMELLEDHDIPAQVGEEDEEDRPRKARGKSSKPAAGRGVPVLVPEELLEEAREVIAERNEIDEFDVEEDDQDEDDEEDEEDEEDAETGEEDGEEEKIDEEFDVVDSEIEETDLDESFESEDDEEDEDEDDGNSDAGVDNEADNGEDTDAGEDDENGKPRRGRRSGGKSSKLAQDNDEDF